MYWNHLRRDTKSWHFSPEFGPLRVLFLVWRNKHAMFGTNRFISSIARSENTHTHNFSVTDFGTCKNGVRFRGGLWCKQTAMKLPKAWEPKALIGDTKFSSPNTDWSIFVSPAPDVEQCPCYRRIRLTVGSASWCSHWSVELVNFL